MKKSLYKDLTTSRGLLYHYYTSPASGEKPTLLFLHGFPSTSFDWRHQIYFFKNEGYGLIVPDMLGYGGTAKPVDPKEYRMSAITTDLIEILDAENVSNAIAIGHDWGSLVTSRLANYYPERFEAFGFISVSYLAPSPNININQMNEFIKSRVGREVYGYWKFMVEDEAPDLLTSKYESFRSLFFPVDPEVWKTNVCPTGGMKAWLTADTKTAPPAYLTEDDLKHQQEVLLSGGFAAPLCWYKQYVLGVREENDKGIPLDKYAIQQPVFYGGGVKDYVCLVSGAKINIGDRCKNPKTVIKEYDADHWVILSHAKALNEDLLVWIQSL